MYEALALLFGFLAMMCWGMFQTLWPDPPKPPKGGKLVPAVVPVEGE